MDKNTLLKVNGQLVSLKELAQTWLPKSIHQTIQPSPEPNSKDKWQLDVTIFKADNKRQIIYGIPLRVDSQDSQGDIVSKEEIEKAAHSFMIASQRYDYQHQYLIPRQDLAVVESYLAPVDFQLNGVLIKEGDWVLATKILNKKLWQSVEKGEFKGYSIKGRGTRKKLT